MRLSEAIRLGSMVTKQAFNGFFDDEGGTCAWGAAYTALGIPLPEKNGAHNEGMLDLFGKDHRTLRSCPACNGRFIDVIVHLNDDHHWTRERIADYVECIERSLGLHAAPEPDARAIEDAVASGQPAISVTVGPLDVVRLEVESDMERSRR